MQKGNAMYFQLFIPTTISGWKYCLKHPSYFFKMGTWRKAVEHVHANQIEATKRAREMQDDLARRLAESYEPIAMNAILRWKLDMLNDKVAMLDAALKQETAKLAHKGGNK
jgi:hypothetical protein